MDGVVHDVVIVVTSERPTRGGPAAVINGTILTTGQSPCDGRFAAGRPTRLR
jgi:hypothetical protein